jgi:hypothetical protein
LARFRGLLDGAVEEQAASLDDAHDVAELGELGEDVAGDEDRLAHASEPPRSSRISMRARGSRPLAGSSMSRIAGIVQEHAGHGEPLLHASREGADLGGGLVTQIGQFEHVVDDLATLGPVDVVRGGEELEIFGDDHVLTRP